MVMPAAPTSLSPLPLLAATEQVHHRITSTLVEGFAQWWQMPLLVAALVAIVAFVLWVYRRDAAELPRGSGALLAVLRLGALAALVAALASALRRRCRQENPWTGAGRKGRHQGCLEALAVLQSIVSAVPGELRGGDLDEVRALREGLPVWRTALGLFSGVPGSIKRPLRELVQVTERVLREREGTDRQGRK